MKKLTILFFAAVLMSGCATGYHSRGFSGGFEETQLDDNVFKVSFKGNSYTSKEKANDYCLLRCSEITIEHDYKYFVVKGDNDFSKSETRYYKVKDYNGNVNYRSNDETRPGIELTIECYDEKPEADSAVYNAEITMRNLKTKYNIE